MEEFLSSSVLAIIVEPLCHHFSLGYLIQLRDTVGQDSIPGCWELWVGCVVYVVQVTYDKLHLVLVSDGSGESLEGQLFDLLGFAIRDWLDNGIKVFLVLRNNIDWLTIGVIVTYHSFWLVVTVSNTKVLLASAHWFIVFLDMTNFSNLLHRLVCNH